MFRKILSILTVCMFVGTLPLMAQGRGGKGSGARGQGGSGMGSGQRTANQTRQRINTRGQQRQQIRATDQQQEQLHNCTGTAERIRTQAREMARTKSATFNAETARQQRDQLREQIRTMDQDHQQLVDGLSAEQKSALETRLQDMDQLRDRVRTHLTEMDGLLAENEPNRKELVVQAQNIEKSMEHWRNQYRKLAAEMGVKD